MIFVFFSCGPPGVTKFNDIAQTIALQNDFEILVLLFHHQPLIQTCNFRLSTNSPTIDITSSLSMNFTIPSGWSSYFNPDHFRDPEVLWGALSFEINDILPKLNTEAKTCSFARNTGKVNEFLSVYAIAYIVFFQWWNLFIWFKLQFKTKTVMFYCQNE
jgi:hypothetical protein